MTHDLKPLFPCSATEKLGRTFIHLHHAAGLPCSKRMFCTTCGSFQGDRESAGAARRTGTGPHHAEDHCGVNKGDDAQHPEHSEVEAAKGDC